MPKYLVELEWVSIPQASTVLNIGYQTLYNQIKEAKNFPQRSPFKRGVAWRQVSARRMQINLTAWQQALDNL
jgi:hypothetical protein